MPSCARHISAVCARAHANGGHNRVPVMLAQEHLQLRVYGLARASGPPRAVGARFTEPLRALSQASGL